jgi:hypothetical protein
MKRIALLVLAASLVAIPTAAAKQPPSFALWVARWNAHSDAVTNKQTDRCDAFVKKNDDKRVGECLVVGLLKVDPGLIAEWNRQLAAIAKPQTPKCRAAIHGYWLAATKAFKAILIYMRSHRHTAATQIAQDAQDEPQATLTSLKDAAKSHAIRVCG